MVKHKWQVAQGVAGWHQLGHMGKHAAAKCAAHYVPAKGGRTACGLLPVRGTTPSTGMAHYGLAGHVATSARTTCKQCALAAPKPGAASGA